MLVKQKVGTNYIYDYEHGMTTSTTYSGITFTWKDDGKLNIKATGVNTSEVYYNFEVDIGSKYVGKILSCVGCNSYVKLYISQTSGSSAVSTQGDDIVIPSAATNRVFIAVYANAPSFDIDVEPMIRDSVITSNNYSAPALSNSDLTVLESEDRSALAEEIDAGAKNKLQDRHTGTNTFYGLTFTHNSDDSITINGTATAEVNYDIFTSTGTTHFNGMVVSGSLPTSGTDAAISIKVLAPDGTEITRSRNGESAIIPSNTNVGSITIKFLAGEKATNRRVYPMICTKAAFAISPKFVPYAKSNYSLTQDSVIHANIGTMDLNNLKQDGIYNSDLLSTTQHAPESGYFTIIVGALSGGSCVQTAYRLNKSAVFYIRHYANNTWSGWTAYNTFSYQAGLSSESQLDTLEAGTITDSLQVPVAGFDTGIWFVLRTYDLNTSKTRRMQIIETHAGQRKTRFYNGTSWGAWG